MKKILLSVVLTIAVVSVNAQVKEIILPATSTTLNVTLQNPAVTSTYEYSEPAVSGFIQTDLTTLSTNSVTVNLKPTVVAGNEATINVVATSNSLAGCSSNAYSIILRVKNTPSFAVSTIAAAGDVCQGGSGVVNLTFNTNILRFKYYIDTDKSGTLSGSEAIVTSPAVNSNTYALATAALTTAGTYPIIITAVIGNDGTNDVSSPSTASASLVVNEKPVIIDIF